MLVKFSYVIGSVHCHWTTKTSKCNKLAVLTVTAVAMNANMRHQALSRDQILIESLIVATAKSIQLLIWHISHRQSYMIPANMDYNMAADVNADSCCPWSAWDGCHWMSGDVFVETFIKLQVKRRQIMILVYLSCKNIPLPPPPFLSLFTSSFPSSYPNLLTYLTFTSVLLLPLQKPNILYFLKTQV